MTSAAAFLYSLTGRDRWSPPQVYRAVAPAVALSARSGSTISRDLPLFGFRWSPGRGSPTAMGDPQLPNSPTGPDCAGGWAPGRSGTISRSAWEEAPPGVVRADRDLLCIEGCLLSIGAKSRTISAVRIAGDVAGLHSLQARLSAGLPSGHCYGGGEVRSGRASQPQGVRAPGPDRNQTAAGARDVHRLMGGDPSSDPKSPPSAVRTAHGAARAASPREAGRR